MPVPAREAIRPMTRRVRYLGKGELKIVDGPDIDRSGYGIRPGCRACSTRWWRPPSTAEGKSFDAADALKVPGVVKVVRIDSSAAPPHFNPLGGIAVVAQNTWAAIQGRNALKIAWDDGPNASYDSVAYKAALEQAARRPAKAVRNDGDFAAAIAKAARTVDAEYYLPHLAHATIEPPAATARIAQGKCEVWGCFQSPQAART
jgi:isoquinoline 1-oxidoreductase beta subunit